MDHPDPGPPMNSCVIERDGESWVLRPFGRHDALISGPTLESAKEQATRHAQNRALLLPRVRTRHPRFGAE